LREEIPKERNETRFLFLARRRRRFAVARFATLHEFFRWLLTAHGLWSSSSIFLRFIGISALNSHFDAKNNPVRMFLPAR
jgi:hypothetical protein